jgi:hypothetical protein
MGMLAEHGVELPPEAAPPPTPLEKAMAALVEGQGQTNATLGMLGDYIAKQGDTHAQTIAELRAEMARPKSQIVHRDPKTNRVLGATIQ